MREVKLLPCPVCNGKSVKLNELYETSDGRGDRWPSIECKCGLLLSLTTDEFYSAQDDFGYTGGYYSRNKEFWNGLHQRLIDKWNTRKPMQEIMERLEQKHQESDQCPKFEKAFRQVAFEEAMQIVEEVGGIDG